jgi:DNA modification methylase
MLPKHSYEEVINMNSKQVPISSVSEDPSNARKHNEKNIASIKASLKRFGQQKPIVLGKNGVVIAGSGTLRAAKELGWDHIYVTESDLTGANAIAYGIADNRTTETSEWDLPILGQHLDALKLDGFDLLDIGFDATDLSNLEFEPNEKPREGKTDQDDIPEVKDTVSRVKPGDVWVLGKHRLFCGDSRNPQSYQILLDNSIADMTFTSPPYNMKSSAKFREDGDSLYINYDDDMDADEWLSFVTDCTRYSLDYSKYQFWNIQLLAGNKSAIPQYWDAFNSKVVDVAIWNKGHGVPQQASRVMNTGFEFVFIFTSEKNPTRAIRIAPEFQGTINNVFDIAGQRKNEFTGIHGATFPVEFPEVFIKNFCPIGGSVLDPFSGTGTTLIACDKLGKRCYAIELEPRYCDVIIERWENFSGEKSYAIQK